MQEITIPPHHRLERLPQVHSIQRGLQLPGVFPMLCLGELGRVIFLHKGCIQIMISLCTLTSAATRRNVLFVAMSAPLLLNRVDELES